jgi:hypothetical protein
MSAEIAKTENKAMIKPSLDLRVEALTALWPMTLDIVFSAGRGSGILRTDDAGLWSATYGLKNGGICRSWGGFLPDRLGSVAKKSRSS